MPPGMCKMAGGGASLKHPVTSLNWWIPAGFFRKPRGSKVKRLPDEYARVWHYRWVGEETEKVLDEPVGIIIRRRIPELWVKVSGKWLTWGTTKKTLKHPRREFVMVDGITKAEYETDLAFGLFKKLRVTYRPVRSFIKRHRTRLRGWNMIATLAATVSCFQIAANSKELWDSWFIVGSLLTLYACVSMLCIFYIAKGRGKK